MIEFIVLLAVRFGEQPTPEVSAGTNALHAQVDQVQAPSLDGSSSASSASSVTYSLEPACERGEGGSYATFYGCGQQATCGENGQLFWVWATDPNGQTSAAGSTCVEDGDTAPAAVLTPGRILDAFRRVPLPTTPLEVQPPGGRTLVNFDTILHTDAAPFTESVQLLNRTVEFDIEPSEFTWTLGDGTTFTTTDPGRPWREGLPMSEYVSHRYLRAGDVDLQLTTTWSARWRVGGGPWRPVQGTVDTTSPAVPLEVTTARPQLVTYD